MESKVSLQSSQEAATASYKYLHALFI